MMKSLADQPCG